jgi:hypothetical protein
MSNDLKCDLCGGSEGTLIPYRNFEYLAHEFPLNCIAVLAKRVKALEALKLSNY